jgi:hypothetical protein
MMFERGFAADREWKPAVTDAYTYRTQFQTAP